MQRMPIITKDGSHTISIPELGVTYHSHHGAVQESMHVFINAGLLVSDTSTCILEMGFGTGLNALLTLIEAEKLQRLVHYTALELFPLQREEIIILNYCQQLNREYLNPFFQQLHACEWEKDIPITPHFTLHKKRKDLINFSTDQQINLIYFDAFAPAAQPELWTKEIFEKLFAMLESGGILVTYCSKGEVRRNMQAAGFTVEKIPGPPGKREMVRAIKK